MDHPEVLDALKVKISREKWALSLKRCSEAIILAKRWSFWIG